METIADYAGVVAEARLGSEAAWRTLYRALSPRMMRYLVAHGVDDPGEVLGDVFVDLARALPRFEGDQEALLTLVFRLLHTRLAEGRYPPAAASVPLDRVLDSAAHAVAGGDAARGAVISGRMRQRLRLLPAAGQEALLLRIFGELSEEEARRAIGGVAPGAVRPFRFTRTGTAVLDTATALVRALPPPPTAHLEQQHVGEAASSARFVASAGEPPATDEVSPPPEEHRPSRFGRTIGVLIATLLAGAVASGWLAEGIAAADVAVRRELSQIGEQGEGSASHALKHGKHDVREALRPLRSATVAATATAPTSPDADVAPAATTPAPANGGVGPAVPTEGGERPTPPQVPPQPSPQPAPPPANAVPTLPEILPEERDGVRPKKPRPSDDDEQDEHDGDEEPDEDDERED